MAKEKRLIDANALKEKLQGHHDFFVDGVGGFRYLTPKDKSRVDEIDNCIAEIVNAPTVDAVEVVHGRWVLRQDDGYEWYECSSCRAQPLNDNVERPVLSDYCPNCGAKMDGGNENA